MVDDFEVTLREESWENKNPEIQLDIPDIKQKKSNNNQTDKYQNNEI